MIYEEYTHMKCKCGGIIGMRDGKNFSCDKCGENDFPKGGFDLEFVKKIHELGMSKFPEITPIFEEMVVELKEIGMFKERDHESLDYKICADRWDY